jgi:hypothetical protein
LPLSLILRAMNSATVGRCFTFILTSVDVCGTIPLHLL